MLHSDQGDSALHGAHDAQDGFCSSCGERYGWWQGVVYEGENGAEWNCAVCAALWGEIPPPEGYVSLDIHTSFWDKFALGIPENSIACVRRNASAMTYLVAWSFEVGWVSTNAFVKGNVLIPKELESPWEKGELPLEALDPVIFRKPLWWAKYQWPETWAYIDNREDELFTRIMRDALGLGENDEWWRSTYSNDSIRWDEWTGALPENHPNRAYGAAWAFLRPWSLIRRQALKEKKEIQGHLFDRACVERVEAGVLAALRNICCPSNVEPPPLWDAIGLPGAFRGNRKEKEFT